MKESVHGLSLPLCVCRYMRDKDKSLDATLNIKKLLNTHLKNLPLRKRLSAQLGFKDTVGSAFDDSFLNDLTRL